MNMGTSSDSGLLPKDPIESFAKGAAEGTLKWTKEEISKAINRLANHDLAFIEDIDIINEVKAEKTTEEFKLYANYIQDKELRKIVQLGLTLRKYNNGTDASKVSNLRDRIVERFGSDGLHIAEFVSSKRLSKYISSIITSSSPSTTDISKKIEYMLKNIDTFTMFIKSEDSLEIRFEQIKTILYANRPETFIITGTRTARNITSSLEYKIKREMYGYTTESFDDGIENVIFIKKK